MKRNRKVTFCLRMWEMKSRFKTKQKQKTKERKIKRRDTDKEGSRQRV